MLKRIAAGAAIAVALVAATVAEAQDAAPAQEMPAPASDYETLLTSVLSTGTTIIGQDIAYPEGAPNVTAAIVTLEPGASTGWHEHVVPLFGYILEGELTVDYGGKGTNVYTAGDGFMEAMNWPHNGANLGDAPVTLIAVYMGAEGLANSTPVDPPAGSSASRSGQHHIVAMNHLRSPRIAENNLDLLTVAATDPRSVDGVEGDQPAPDFTAVWPLDAYRIPALEFAVDRGDARGEQALAGAERPHRPLVHPHRAAGLQMARNPGLAGSGGGRLGKEPGTARPVADGGKGVQSVAVGDHHGRSPRGGNAPGLDLGLHPAA